MHETGLIQGLLRRIEAAAFEAEATRVAGVAIWLGALSQMSPEHFREHFDTEALGTIAEGATVEIEHSDDVGHPHALSVVLQSVDLVV